MQTAPSGLNNGGQRPSRRPRFMQVFRTPPSDGWTTWVQNKADQLVVPAAVAALSTLMEQQRYCFQRPIQGTCYLSFHEDPLMIALRRHVFGEPNSRVVE